MYTIINLYLLIKKSLELSNIVIVKFSNTITQEINIYA